MSELRMTLNHFRVQSVFIFGIKVYKLVRWRDTTCYILWIYFYNCWKDKNSLRQNATSQCFTLGVSVCGYKPWLLSGCWEEIF